MVNLGLALASLAVVLALLELSARVFLGPIRPLLNLTRVPASIRAPASFEGVPYLLAANAAATQSFGSRRAASRAAAIASSDRPCLSRLPATFT